MKIGKLTAALLLLLCFLVALFGKAAPTNSNNQLPAAHIVAKTSSLQQPSKEAAVTIDAQTQTIYKLPDFFSYTFTAITILVSVVTVVLGGLLAFNFAASRDVVKKAEAELDILIKARNACEREVGDLKSKFAKHLEEKTAEFLNRAQEQVRTSITNHYEAAVIPRIKQELLELLNVEPVLPQKIFPKLTDILNYPDDQSLKIYRLCLEKCSGNDDITKKVNQGLLICTQRLTDKNFAADGTLGGS